MSKTKSKSQKPSWQWWTEKYLTEQARDIVMARPRSMGTSKTQIKLEMEIEKKRLAEKWEEEAKKKLQTTKSRKKMKLLVVSGRPKWHPHPLRYGPPLPSPSDGFDKF